MQLKLNWACQVFVGTLICCVAIGASGQDSEQSAQDQAVYNQLVEKVNALKKEHGSDHEATLSAQRELAVQEFIRGNEEKSDQMFSDVISRLERTKGVDDPLTWEAQTDYALSLMYRQLPAGFELMEKVISRQIKKLGPNDSSVLKSRNILANQYDATNQFEKALKLFDANYGVLVELKGEDDLEAIKMLGARATMLMRLEKLEDSEALFRNVIDLLEEHHSDSQVQTLLAKRDLAVNLNEQEKIEESDKYFQEAFQGLNRAYGLRNRDTLETLEIYAGKLSKRGRYAEAANARQIVLDTLAEVAPPDSDIVIGNRLKLIDDLLADNDFGNAAVQQLAVLEVFQARGGPDHPDVIGLSQDTVSNLLRVDAFAVAEPIIRNLLRHYTAKDGVDSESVFWVRESLAKALVGQGKAKDAIAIITELVPAAGRLFDEGGDEVVEATILLSQANFANGNADKAMEILLKLLDEQKKAVGEKHQRVFDIEFLIYEIDYQNENYESAVKGFENLLEKQLQVFDAQDVEVLSTRNRLAICYAGIGNYDKAITQYQLCASGLEKIKGKLHPDTLSAKGDLGFILFAAAKYEEAETVYRDCLAGWFELEDRGPNFRLALRQVANCVSKKGEHSVAQMMLKDFIRFAKENEVPEIEIWEAKGFIAASYWDQKKLAEAKVLLTECRDYYLKAFGPDNFQAQSLEQSLQELEAEIQANDK